MIDAWGLMFIQKPVVEIFAVRAVSASIAYLFSGINWKLEQG